VVAMDVVQLFVYLSGAAASMALILHALPGGWSDVLSFAARGGANKFEVFNLSPASGVIEYLASPYTLAGSLLGGTFLTMASHGTDQLLVQRLLACRSARESRKALMLDASFIVLQFAFFLVLGLCLFAFYGGVPFAALGLKSSDEVFPLFIVRQLPSGLAGLLVAGVLASAMGTLSSSISSLASSTFLDLFRLTRKGRALEKAGELRVSRLLTLFWGIVLIGGAMLFTDSHSPVVEIGLRIASFTYGGLLGVFFLGLLFTRCSQRDAVAGFIAGLCAMAAVMLLTRIDYVWHTMIGCVVAIIAGNFSARLFPAGK
ncbi:MAG TPA: sodium:solute symporter, partial [Bacteroidota bacterium]|nr:sodium:solute symporter [Bacteroidota bacterium]